MDSALRIGIITMPHVAIVPEGTSHIMKSYIDWFSTRGVQIVVIPYDTPRPEWFFSRVDGILIPGGGAKKNEILYMTCLSFLRHSLEVWKRNRTLFPIWGTCLGYEIIITLLSHIFPLQNFHALDYMKNIKLSRGAQNGSSRLFQSSNFTSEYIKILESNPIMEFNHSHGISPQKFRSNSVLNRLFSITSTAEDKLGKTFVNSIEGRNGLPLYGVQGHPERQPFLCAPFLDFYVEELRRSRNQRKNRLDNLRGYTSPASFAKCKQYDEHTDVSCFFFKESSDGGNHEELIKRIPEFIKKILAAGERTVINE